MKKHKIKRNIKLASNNDRIWNMLDTLLSLVIAAFAISVFYLVSVFSTNYSENNGIMRIVAQSCVTLPDNKPGILVGKEIDSVGTTLVETVDEKFLSGQNFNIYDIKFETKKYGFGKIVKGSYSQSNNTVLIAPDDSKDGVRRAMSADDFKKDGCFTK